MPPALKRVQTIGLWTVTVFLAVALGAPGLGKLLTTGEWDRLFQSWGYPRWFMFVVGAVEVVGALALLVPRFAWMAAFALAAVMAGAVATLLSHPGSHLFRGRQAPMTTTEPAVWFVLLVIVGVVRWRQTHSTRDSNSNLSSRA